MPSPPPKPDRPAEHVAPAGRCPAWLHSTTLVALSLAFATAGALLGRWLNGRLGFHGEFANLLVTGVFFTAGFNAPLWLFLPFVPARCPHCRGKSWGGFRGGVLRYTCGGYGGIRDSRVTAD